MGLFNLFSFFKKKKITITVWDLNQMLNKDNNYIEIIEKKHEEIKRAR
ncbi:MAG: hypothetical protein ACRC5W_06195 [Cetobacterium sp.]